MHALYPSIARHPTDAGAEPVTFVTVDLFTFDSTSSPLLGGWAPAFRFLSQFQVECIFE